MQLRYIRVVRAPKLLVMVPMAAALVALASLWLVRTRLMSSAEQSQAALRSEAKRLLPTFLKLGAVIDADPFFAGVRPDADAGPYLNPRVGWEKPVPPPAHSELTLPSDLEAMLDDAAEPPTSKKGWFDHQDDFDTSKLDFGWLQRLQHYGYWDILSSSPLNSAEGLDFASMPLPYYLSLMHWVKLRWVEARRRGDWSEASAETRHLAWLCYSSNLLLGAMTAMAILKIERRAYEVALAEGRDLGDWHAYSDDWVEQAKAVVWAAFSYASPLLGAEVADARKVTAGRCAGLTENSAVVRWRQLAGIDVPAGLLAEYRAPSAPCRLELASRILSTGAPAPLLDNANVFESLVVRLMPHVSVIYVESVYGGRDRHQRLQGLVALHK